MRPSAIRLPLAAVAIAAALTGCGGSDSPQATEPSADPGSTSAAASPTFAPEDVCPPKLPRDDDPEDHGFGAQEDARQEPSLPAPEQAWTCQYDAVDAGQTPDGGTEFAWVLHGTAAEVAEPELGAFASALDRVQPYPRSGRMCTQELGPRWLVVYPGSDGLIGVVVDDFGCREVRLTDDPATTPPGAGDGDGTVPGVLDGGTEVLTALGLGRAG